MSCPCGSYPGRIVFHPEAQVFADGEGAHPPLHGLVWHLNDQVQATIGPERQKIKRQKNTERTLYQRRIKLDDVTTRIRR